MAYLECSEGDCCHNKAGCCCLDSIGVKQEAGKDVVCCSYSCGSTDTDSVEQPEPRTSIRCDDTCCCHNEDCHCAADRVCVKECSCGPECATREDK
jgi:hypothetical protein